MLAVLVIIICSHRIVPIIIQFILAIPNHIVVVVIITRIAVAFATENMVVAFTRIRKFDSVLYFRASFIVRH